MITKTIGIILFKRDVKKIKYLLLRHHKNYWNFPKGRPDPRDKNELDTAFREVWEETGIVKEQIKLVKNFKAGYVYSFKSPYSDELGNKVTKRAIFFLGQVSGEKIKISDEHVGFGWFSYDKALKKLAKLKGPAGESCWLLKKAQKIVECQGFGPDPVGA